MTVTADQLRIVSYCLNGALIVWGAADLFMEERDIRRGASGDSRGRKRFGGILVALLGLAGLRVTWQTDQVAAREEQAVRNANAVEVKQLKEQHTATQTAASELRISLSRAEAARAMAEQKLESAVIQAAAAAEAARLNAEAARTEQRFHPVSAAIRNNVIQRLATWAHNQNGRVLVSVAVEAGNQRRRQLGSEIGEFLENRGLGGFEATNLYVGNSPDVPVTLRFGVGDHAAAAALASALSPLIVSRIMLAEEKDRPPRSFQLFISGEPLFSRQGAVEIK